MSARVARRFGFAAIVLFIGILTACELIPPPEGGRPVPDLPIAWRVSINAGSNESLATSGNDVIFVEFRARNLISVDMRDGTVNYRIATPATFRDHLAVDGSTLITRTLKETSEEPSPPSFTWVDTTDGSLIGLIDVDRPEAVARWSGSFRLIDRTVYYHAEGGLMYFSLDDVEEIGPLLYRVSPTMLYPIEMQFVGRPTIWNGIAFSGWNDRDNGNEGSVVAVEIASGEVLWQRSLGYLYGQAYGDWLVFGDEVVFAPGAGVVRLRLDTGEPVWQNRDAWVGRGSDHTLSVYEGRGYFTNPSFEPFDPGEGNIYAVDLTSGEKVWNQTYPYSLGSNPIVHEGIVYVATPTDLRLYDADDGRELAVYDEVKGDYWQMSNLVTHGDMLVFKSSRWLYGIRMDFRLNGRGELVRR